MVEKALGARPIYLEGHLLRCWMGGDGHFGSLGGPRHEPHLGIDS